MDVALGLQKETIVIEVDALGVEMNDGLRGARRSGRGFGVCATQERRGEKRRKKRGKRTGQWKPPKNARSAFVKAAGLSFMLC